MALWQQAWVVLPDADGVREVKASVAPYTVTVRDPGQTVGGRHYTPLYFETYFGTTREQAIELFVAHHTMQIEVAEDHIKQTQELLRRAALLREGK